MVYPQETSRAEGKQRLCNNMHRASLCAFLWLWGMPPTCLRRAWDKWAAIAFCGSCMQPKNGLCYGKQSDCEHANQINDIHHLNWPSILSIVCTDAPIKKAGKASPILHPWFFHALDSFHCSRLSALVCHTSWPFPTRWILCVACCLPTVEIWSP